MTPYIIIAIIRICSMTFTPQSNKNIPNILLAYQRLIAYSLNLIIQT
ncbi:MAG: hypothetical protein LN573_02780 [Rickettsia endosymbiont of Oxypoda opaca]|nr:hypothetical protein [Rickettsia endosymbiont of Oxypoda opaca]